MDAEMYSKMPTEFFSGSGWPTAKAVVGVDRPIKTLHVSMHI